MEIEFKFLVPLDRLGEIESALRAGEFEQLDLQARYFDTRDGALARADVALRMRKEGGHWVQTAKARGDGPLDRFEHNVDLGNPTDPTALPDIGLHEGTHVGHALEAAIGDAALVETFSTAIHRIVHRHTESDTQVEFALDVGSLIAQGHGGAPTRESAVCELEIELVHGDVAVLVSVAKRWVAEYGLAFSTVSKAARGQRLLGGNKPVAAVKSRAPNFSTHGEKQPDGAEIQRRVVSACLAQILPNASEVAAGSADADAVHQLRIGIRRLRTALRELDGLAENRFDPAWEGPLRHTFAALGRSRDGELLTTKMQPMLEAAGGPQIATTVEANDTSGMTVSETVCLTPFQIVLVELIGFVTHASNDAPADDGADNPANARKLIGKRLNGLHRRVVKGGRRFESLEPEDQHKVRKQLKRLRYLAEFVAPLFDEKSASRYIAKLTPAQDTLGDFNDMSVAAVSYRRLAVRDQKAWFAVGWLNASQQHATRDCRKALEKIEDARKFWKPA
ncbi:CHAD domain-containing protein [Variovorax sp. RHLX14]|uniref:CYTH and CHAD domain-containing protein n=1 Tax=Variovorax sp. RHLX14 TaxID=1259731 RepID=UPI003F44F545